MSVSGFDPEDEAALRARLEAFRQSGIGIDAQGRLNHAGQLVEHAGLRQALFRWLDRLPAPDGRYVLRLDDKRYAYVDVDDTPLVVNALSWRDATAWLSLSDGSEEALDPRNLTVDDAGILRTWVRNKTLEARLSTAATATLTEAIVLEPTPQIKLTTGVTAAILPRSAWPRV